MRPVSRVHMRTFSSKPDTQIFTFRFRVQDVRISGFRASGFRVSGFGCQGSGCQGSKVPAVKRRLFAKE